MIITGSFRDMKPGYDEIWVIVRSLKKLPAVKGANKIIHVPELSPSPALYGKFLKWKEMGEWNEQKFQEEYVPEFIKEMQMETAKQKLRDLYKLGKTKNILLVCYCPVFSLCHRNIVLGILQGMNEESWLNGQGGYACNEINNDVDLSTYYKMYQNTKTTPLIKEKEPRFVILVAGSRSYNNYTEFAYVMDFVLSEQNKHNIPIEIVSGGATGADALAERYADEREYMKHIMPAEWDKYGKRAGFIRNSAMHEYLAGFSVHARGCICFWDEESKGTAHNFELADKYGTPIKVFSSRQHKFLDKKEFNEKLKR